MKNIRVGDPAGGKKPADAAKEAATHLDKLYDGQGREAEALQNFVAALSAHLPEGCSITAFRYGNGTRVQVTMKRSGKPQKLPPEEGNITF